MLLIQSRPIPNLPPALPSVRDSATPLTQRSQALRHLVNHIGVALASKLVPIASIFLYSHFMAVYDYGLLNLASSYLWIIGILITFNLHTGIGRFIYADPDEFPRFLGTTLLSIGAIYVAFGGLVLANLGAVEGLLSLRGDVILLLLLIVAGSIFESMYTQIAIYKQASGNLMRLVAIKACCTLLLSLLLLFLMRDEKYLAVLYADAAISVLFSLYVMSGFHSHTVYVFSKPHFKYMVQYSVPLIPYMLCLTLLSQFDRVMINHYFGKEATGLYSLAYNVGILMLMVVTALLNVFTPAFFEGIREREYERVVRDSDGIFALGVFATVVLVLFGESGFSILVPAKYADSLGLIPVVALGGLCFVVFQLWARVISFANRTYLLSIIAVIATGLKFGLNVLLLPVYGYKVAALTTVVAYLVMSILCVWVVNRQINLFKVSLTKSGMYIFACAGVLLFFEFVALPVWLEYAVKILVLVIAGLHLKGDILDVLLRRNKPIGG